MARIDGVRPAEAGPKIKLLYWFMRKGTAKLTGRPPAAGRSGIEPVEIWAYQPKLLMGMGRFQGAVRKAPTVDEHHVHVLRPLAVALAARPGQQRKVVRHRLPCRRTRQARLTCAAYTNWMPMVSSSASAKSFLFLPNGVHKRHDSPPPDQYCHALL